MIKHDRGNSIWLYDNRNRVCYLISSSEMVKMENKPVVGEWMDLESAVSINSVRDRWVRVTGRQSKGFVCDERAKSEDIMYGLCWVEHASFQSLEQLARTRGYGPALQLVGGGLSAVCSARFRLRLWLCLRLFLRQIPVNAHVDLLSHTALHAFYMY